MTSYGFVCGTVLFACAVSVSAGPKTQPQELQAQYGRLPLRFEPNRGQAAPGARFVTRGAGYSMLFGTDEARLALTNGKQRAEVRVRMIGGRAVEPVALDPLPGVTHYLHGNAANRWRTGIEAFSRLRYAGVYPGVDLVYYGNQRSLEFDFVVSPGADPSRIRMRMEGGKARVSREGDLLVETDGGTLVQHRPVVYQMVAGRRVESHGRYRLASGDVSFELGPYDRSLPLVIDPVLSYSGYLGGGGGDAAYGVAVDAAGNAYIIGQTTSGNFPTSGPLSAANAGDADVFVTKLSPGGNSVVFSTYLGGSGEDAGVGIAVNATGVYLTGHTASTDFPTASPLQQGAGGVRDGFVAKLNPAGNSLVYATYLGGSDEDRALAIAVDSSNAAYVAGTTASGNFPVSGAAFGSHSGAQRDAFVTKLADNGALAYSTFLPGNNDEAALGIAVDSTGAAYVTGFTRSTNFPTVNPVQANNAGGLDAFISKLNAAGNALVFSTYLGGSNDDRATGIALDADNAPHVGGWTFSGNFPTMSAFSTSFSGAYEGFVTKLAPAGSSFTYSTYLGGNGEDYISSIAVDATGAAVVTGYSTSTNLPQVATSPAFANGRTNGAFVSRLAPAGNALQFSTYFGGASTDQANSVAVDSNRAIYAVGSTLSIEFPAISAVQNSLQGSTDAFAVKFSEGTPVTYSVTTNPSGLSMIVDGITTTAPRFFGWAPGSSHTLNVPSPQGSGSSRYTFASWSQGGTQNQTVTAPASNATYTANFTTQHQLTLTVQPASAGSINPSPLASDNFYAAGTNVQLGITTVPGYQFTGFTGDVNATTAPQSVVMSAPRSVTAHFTCLYSLNPTQAIVDGGASSGSFTLTTGLGCATTAVSSSDWITVTGGANGSGSRTVSYQVAANNSPINRTGSIALVDGGVTVQTFTVMQGAQLPASITINTVPNGLQFTMDGETYTAPRTFQFDPGSTHTVSAVSPQTSNGTRRTFANWTNGASQTHQVTTPSAGSLAITANYTTSYQLSTAVNPAGSGSFTLVPASSDGFYAPGTVVSVAASSTVAQFAGFSGSLAGITNPQPITMDGPRSVTATFTPQTCGTAYTFSPQNIAIPASGGSYTVTVNTAAGCFWGASLSAAFVDPWVTLQGGNPAATGTGTFTFQAAANTTNFPRTASINVQGLLVQLVQSGVDVVLPFNDVAPTHLFFDYITLMKRYGNSVGCGNNNYCPEDVTTRAVMAELIIRARFGEQFSYVLTPYFTDVPTTHAQFKYIQKMKELGITDGCTATTYCPGNPVTRGEMAVFLIRTRLGVLTPQQFSYGTTPLFTDTPASNIFFAYIQKMKELGITAGCTATSYCINDPNTLGQMAVFVIRSFNTP